MEIGIRALRDSLSRQLELVKAGYTVVVTEHGKTIAKIVPMDGQSVLDRLIEEGRVTPAREPKGELPPPIDLGTSILDLVDEQRR
jgi:antitoxin (DNA-binding transcriptional repressor) of toxin-antitoxin stability system